MRQATFVSYTRAALCALLGLWAVAAPAQNGRNVTQLLFEPVPLVEGRPTLDFPLATFVSAAAAVPVAAAGGLAPDGDTRNALRDRISDSLIAIGDLESLQGPFADPLRENLFATGQLYQTLGEHERALALFERTLQVSRINHGLDQPEQVAVLEAIARSYLALEKPAEADAMMDSAFRIEALHHGENSAGLVAAQQRLGDWNTRAFLERSSILVNIPRMNVQNFVRDPRNYMGNNYDVRSTPLFKLYQARGNYLEAIKILVDAGDYGNPALMELERKLLTTLFLTTHREDILYEPDFYLSRKKSKTASRLNQNSIELLNAEEYALGLESHRRRMGYLVADTARTPAQLVTAMLEEADWQLMFGRKTLALDSYRAAYRFFAENPQIVVAAGELLYPALPQVLPTYLPPPNSREKLGIGPDSAVQYFGFIDVSFALNEFGKARRIRQLGTGGEVTRDMEIRLGEYLRRVQFRPRFAGTEVATGALTLRYYLGL